MKILQINTIYPNGSTGKIKIVETNIAFNLAWVTLC